MFDSVQARTQMIVGQITTMGVNDRAILEALNVLPREEFVDESQASSAYRDELLPCPKGRVLLEPAVHARLIQAAALDGDDLVLDVAGGSTGYSAALLSKLVSTVIALEEPKYSCKEAQGLCTDMDICNIVPVEGVLSEGAPSYGPFQAIILNGAVAEIPKSLVGQLSEDGRLLATLKPRGAPIGTAVLVRPVQGETAEEFSVQPLFDAHAPYLSCFEPKEAFTF